MPSDIVDSVSCSQLSLTIVDLCVVIGLQLYAPLNIFVALVGIVVWSEKDEIQISVKGDETLTNFLHYRRVRLSKEHPNDNAQLLTYVNYWRKKMNQLMLTGFYLSKQQWHSIPRRSGWQSVERTYVHL